MHKQKNTNTHTYIYIYIQSIETIHLATPNLFPTLNRLIIKGSSTNPHAQAAKCGLFISKVSSPRSCSWDLLDGESLGSISADFTEFDWYFNGIIVIQWDSIMI